MAHARLGAGGIIVLGLSRRWESVEGSGARRRETGLSSQGLLSCLAALGGICALHGALLACFWSPAWLGFPHDDTLYLAAGKSLAEGGGAVLPNLPGEPAQTKYPPLYPLLLAALWRVSGNLDGVLAAAFWLNWGWGAAFLAGSFVVMRQLGLERRAALGLSAAAAVHPAIAGLNVVLLSDMPFMALSVWALAAAHWASEKPGDGPVGRWDGWSRWGLAAGLLWLAVLTRSLGIAVIAGIAGYGWFGRRRAAALAAAASGAAVFAAQSWWAWRHALALGASGGGLRQTLMFYTSYAGFWQLCVPDWRTLAAVAGFNLREVLKEPAMECFLLPVAGFEGGLLQMVGVAVSVGVMKGLIGMGREHGWHPAHAALAVYVPLITLWNYPLAGRFLLVFMPLFLAGGWWEFSLLTRTAAAVLRGREPALERFVCGVLLAAAAALPVYAVYRIGWWIPRSLSRAVAQRETAAAENGEAMRWIRAHTSARDRFISYQDARLYLLAGRQAIRPMAFRTSALYLQDESILNADLAGMRDVVRGTGARYWVRAEEDFHLEVGEQRIAAAVDELLAGTAVVFRSSGGRVRIHDLAGLGF